MPRWETRSRSTAPSGARSSRASGRTRAPSRSGTERPGALHRIARDGEPDRGVGEGAPPLPAERAPDLDAVERHQVGRAERPGEPGLDAGGPEQVEHQGGPAARAAGARRPGRAPAGPRRNSAPVPGRRSGRGPGSRSRSPARGRARRRSGRAAVRPGHGRLHRDPDRPRRTRDRGAGGGLRASGQTREAGARLRMAADDVRQRLGRLLQNEEG